MYPWQNATVTSSPSAVATPSTTPRTEKRALRVTTGIANHPSVALPGPPVTAMLAAMMTSEAAHAANIAYSGRASRAICLSASMKMTPARSSGTIVQ